MPFPAGLSTAWGWAKDKPWAAILLAGAGLVAVVGLRFSLEPERLDALESRVTAIESHSPLLEGLARVTCLKTDRITTEAAGLPCDSLLGRR